MINRCLFLSFAFLSIFAVQCFAQNEFVDGVQLTTAKAPWSMRVLGNDLDITGVNAKPDQASAYFMMVSASTKLNVSVFIEPVAKCKTAEDCRDFVLNLGNPAWGKFEQLAKGKLKDASYFEFYRPTVQDKPMKMLDMYAEFVSQGYWVDVHISKVLYTKADHALFEKVINSIEFVPKAAPAAGDFDAELGKGQATASAWLGLWDKDKCKESYAALAPLTRQDTTETDWTGYCSRVRQGLGANTSRKLIAAAFTASLPGKTDRPLAVLAYHSAFAKLPSMVEITGLMLDKRGSWLVTNYLPQ